jgi:hypothetical protein
MSLIPTYPSVVVNEVDLSTRISSGQNTSYGAIAINSTWGPASEITLITSEKLLIETFGKPTANTFTDFFVAANFLAYSNSLQVVRVVDTVAKNATAGNGNTGILIRNQDDYVVANSTVLTGTWVAKYPGDKGNSLYVATIDGASANATIAATTFTSNVYTSNSTTNNASLLTWDKYFTDLPRTSQYSSSFGGANDEIHILVFDLNGAFSGVAGTLLEKYSYLSKANGAKTEEGLNNYYRDVINAQSNYIWVGGNYVLGANSSGTPSTIYGLSGTNNAIFAYGANANTANTGLMYQDGYDLFADKKTVDVSHFIAGNVSNTTVTALITIAENRGDSIVYVSPQWSDVQPGQTQSQIATKIVNFKKDAIGVSSSYYFVDGNWKYQYDKYNDVNRWIPCCGDVAGLKAKAEATNDIWWNGSGYNRGILKNVIKLAWNPKDDYMGQIYQNSVNPIINEAGSSILLGDKTGLTKPSAFDRINVRSLFNILKKQLSSYLKYGLFEFNDEFTRAQLTSQVQTYLNTIKSRRGIQEYVVVCDTTNNTGAVLNENQLVMDIYIKPNKSINWIVLNLVNVGSSVSFNEVVGISGI